MDDIKILIVPSLWYEAWGIVVTETHLPGILVIASDAGAIPESMLGLPYIVPIKPLTGARDEDGGYIAPDQDVEPWAKTLEQLMTDKREYEKVSERSRNETVEWLTKMDETAHEKWLLNMIQLERALRQAL